MSTRTCPKIVLGMGGVGDSVIDHQVRFGTPGDVQAYVSVFRKHGHKTLDTARGYPVGAPGTSEVAIGKTNAYKWAEIDTKVRSFVPGLHTKENIADSIQQSLSALGVDKVHTLYLHAPDRTVPFEETLEAMDKAYQDGKFVQLGISNYSPQEVEDMLQICESKGYIKPKVYQGQYNMIARRGEKTLLPVLRKHGISFYAWSAAAAGFFSGYVTGASSEQHGSRWDKNTQMGQSYSMFYLNPVLLELSKKITTESVKMKISGHAVALRWALHHSALNGEDGDAILIAASSVKQLETNLMICEDGPLPEQLVKLVDSMWEEAHEFAPPGWV